jgi:hypothetical protein
MTEKMKLPIGIQTFHQIREDGYYYVDKSQYAVDMANQGKYYFLSRPRRFGKSLFVDTLKELFSGSQALFKGLFAGTNWDWSKSWPVLKFSFAGGVLNSLQAVRSTLVEQLSWFEKEWGFNGNATEINIRFKQLIRHIHQSSGLGVVILVDEYDKPILDAIEDRQKAREIRNALRDFYSVIKDSDAHVHFAFLTGVSKFSKAGIFSGLNNLRDITVSSQFSAICGYTQKDLDEVFAVEMQGLDRDEVRRWYNGYSWLGESVYNPFDILLLFSERTIAPYWFESGTPTFLINLLLEKKVFTPRLNQTISSEMLLSTFDVDTMPIEALLFQTGYLTIDTVEEIAGSRFFYLKYPNREVFQSLNICLVGAFLLDPSFENRSSFNLIKILQATDLEAMEQHFKSLFAAIPHDWHRKNNIAHYEGYYASIFYSHFASLGLDIRVEDATSLGRIDMTLLFNGQVFIFEFKVIPSKKPPSKSEQSKGLPSKNFPSKDLELTSPPDNDRQEGSESCESCENSALKQIKEKQYASKYRDRREPIHLIGVEFSEKERNVSSVEVETLV